MIVEFDGMTSCSIVTAMFYKGDQAKSILSPKGVVHIIKVTMVGYQQGSAWMIMAKLMEQYAGELEDATSV
jgi:hypothetical protein